MTICVGREKVNWPKGPREAGLGRDPGAPPAGVIMSPNPSFRGPEGPWESAFLLTGKRIATSGPRPSSQ